MKRIAGMMTAVLLITGCADTSSSEPAEEDAALEESDTADPAEPAGPPPLTAEGWGDLRIGMTRDEVTAVVGGKANPEAVGGPEPEYCEEYQPADAPPGLFVMLEEGILTRITLSDESDLTTPAGIRVGDTAAAVREAYGDHILARPHTYVDPPGEYLTTWTVGTPTANGMEDENARGIRYEIGMEGTVTAIHAGSRSIQFVEGCL